MTSFPNHRRDANGNTSDDPTPNAKTLITYWPIMLAIFAAGGTCSMFAMQSSRIDKLETRQAAGDLKTDARWQTMDDRMRGVENGLATLLERTKPHP
jgi:hypothetical protein